MSEPVLRKLIKSVLRYPADALIASSRKLPRRVAQEALNAPTVAAKTYPFDRDKDSYVIPNPEQAPAKSANDPLPMPPQKLWEGYAYETEVFLNSGKKDVDVMLRILGSVGFSFDRAGRVLELGCAAGRMLRWLREYAGKVEIWGTDISVPHIAWCQGHLSPPFRFVSATSFPHLPFEDGYFDLIYAGSVFTHIPELADAWLMELRRILRDGGKLYVTIHDKHTIEVLFRDRPKMYLTQLLQTTGAELMKTDFGMLVLNRAPKGAQVFYDIEYCRKVWGQYFNFRTVVPDAHNYQTAIVLEKPPQRA